MNKQANCAIFVQYYLFRIYLEYYLAIKWTEVVLHATTWMNLESIMCQVKEANQKKKPNHILYKSIKVKYTE